MSKSDKEQMKLQEGDYVTNLTKEQWDELLALSGQRGYLTYHQEWGNSLIVGKYTAVWFLLHRYEKEGKTKLSFADFRQRAINTFK